MSRPLGRIEIDAERCKGCSLCLPVCPKEVIALGDWLNAKGYTPAELVDPKNQCTGCMLCAFMCPEAAITVFRADRRSRADARVAA